MLSRHQLQQIALAARLYYEERKTQDEIARHLGLSRPKISRLLQLARDEGIVQITIRDPFTTDTKLSAALCQATRLSRAVVVPGNTADTELTRSRLGQAAARLLDKTVRAKDVLGVGWGRTLHAVAASLEGRPRNGLLAVPLLGSLGQIAPSFQVHELTRQIAEAFSGMWRQLYVPAIVDNDDSRAALSASRDVKPVMDDWARLTIALVGIGNVDFDSEMQMLFASYLDDATQRRLRAADAVGDICMRFFDSAGRPIREGLHGVISVELEQLRRTPKVIAVAGGAEKAAAILGAVRGGYIDLLVTDEAAARAILDLVESAE